MPLSKEAIIKTCITILNKEGAEGLSMRTLGKELGVKAASLYWHFEDKTALYGEIAEYMCQKYEIPTESSDIKADIMNFFRSYRAMLLTVRDSVVIFESSIPNTHRRIQIIKVFSKNLMRIGVKREDLMTISNMLNNYVLSFTADEVRFKNTPPEVRKSFNEIMNSEDSIAFMSDRNFDEQFDLGLRILLTGIETVEK